MLSFTLAYVKLIATLEVAVLVALIAGIILAPRCPPDV
jgi:hypothetical protein